MGSLRSYNLGILISEYLKRECQICHTNPSKLIKNDLVHNPRINFKYLNTGIICQSCHDSIDWNTKKIQIEFTSNKKFHVQHASFYQSPIAEYIKRFKYKKDMSTLPVLVHVLRQLILPDGIHAHNSVIVPVPTTNIRLANRGFDPVTILARYLSDYWGIPIWRGVSRLENGISQAGLSREERVVNMNGAFELMEFPPVSNLLIFDDVVTTGSTMKELVMSINDKVSLYQINNSDIKFYGFCLAHGR